MLVLMCLIFRYEEFFGPKKKTVSKRKSNLADGSDKDLGSDHDELDEVFCFVPTYTEYNVLQCHGCI